MPDIPHHTAFPEAISNTIREAFAVCPRKFYWGYIRKLAPQGESIHLVAGGAFAKGLEITRKAFYEDKKSEFEAQAIGFEAMRSKYDNFDVEYGMTDSNKSFENLSRAFTDYFMEYPLATDRIKPLMQHGKASVEFSFAIPTEHLHPETGNPILYAGKFDMLGREGAENEEPVLWVTDEKTTSQLGATWSSQWDLNSQFSGYCYAAKQYGYPVVGAMIRGIGLLKTKISHQQVIQTRSDWQLDRWYTQMNRDTARMIEMWKADVYNDGSPYDQALGSACTSYGACPFKRLCEAQNPEEWVPIYFKESTYNPLEPGEES